MRKSRIFFTMLLSLFMFQAIWNVAAGFCLHEKGKSSTSIQHFGHHQSETRESKAAYPSKVASFNQTDQANNLAPSDLSKNTFNFLDDHHDHLPSCAHFIVVEPTINSQRPNVSYGTDLGNVAWNNLYQSPLLIAQNPPPEYASL
ncbi:cation transporter [Acinetobacter rudis]|uniref:cation efflux protein, CzcI-like n=1 Tax=Acinetobacter rudis TaxID=632955 RepID=UPI00280EBCB1|nr:cation efflux protein, CzcI-like [Acinetobacter rudis]MDQ8953079.1 cation transporter [Acinetobacter rudis]